MLYIPDLSIRVCDCTIVFIFTFHNLFKSCKPYLFIIAFKIIEY